MKRILSYSDHNYTWFVLEMNMNNIKYYQIVKESLDNEQVLCQTEVISLDDACQLFHAWVDGDKVEENNT